MSCIEHSGRELRRLWINSKEGKTEIISRILKELGYENIQRTKQIPEQCEFLISGNYKGKDGFTYGVFANYNGKENEEYIEISTAENERTEEIKKRIKAVFPNVECRIKNCSSKNKH